MDANRRARTIALLVPVTSRGRRLRDVRDSDLLRTLLPGVLETASWSRDLAYHVYVGYDAGDRFYDRAEQVTALRREFSRLTAGHPIRLTIERCVGTTHSPCAVWNTLFRRAYDEGCDFFYQIGDDVRLETDGWARDFPAALQSNRTYPGLGVTGAIDANAPDFPGLTQAFVSRVHMEVFGTLYPPAFRNWFSDNWLTAVYSPLHIRRWREHRVRNAGGAERYVVDARAHDLLGREVQAGRQRLDAWLARRHPPRRTSVPVRRTAPESSGRRQRASIYYIPNGYDHHIASALDRLFTNVRPFGSRDVADYVDRRVLAHETPDATRVVLDEVTRMRPDLVYAESAYNVDPDAFAFIRRVLRIPVTMWYGDPSSPPGEVERLVRYARVVDWQVVVDRTPVDAAARSGLDNVELIPNFGYDHYFRPRRARKRVDVLFSGKSYNGLEALYPEARRRRACIRRLDRELGSRLFVVGEGWERHRLHHASPARVPEWEVNDLNNASRIVLAYDAAQLPGFTSVRTWNTLLSGAFLLIRRFPGIETYFENHRHLVWFDDEDEALALIRRYLRDDAARLRIAREGRRLVETRGWTFSTLARYLVARGTGRERRRFAEIHGGLGPRRARASSVRVARRPSRVSLVAFGTPDWSAALDRLAASAPRGGVDIVQRHGVQDILGTPFHLAHLDLFAARRGFGYWLWKPYLIRQALARAADDDIVVYADAGIELVAPLTPLVTLARARTPVVVFGVHGHANRTWTKREAFVTLGCDTRRFWDAECTGASLLLFRKTTASVELVDAWLRACTTGRIVTDDPNPRGRRNLPGFREHRHDQALLSLLCEQRGLEHFRDPSQWGNHLKLPEYRAAGEFLAAPYSPTPLANSPYGTLIDHHRRRG